MRQLVQGYDELKLRIGRRGAGSYHVFASTRSAEVSTGFELPFGEHELENFILKVSHPRGRRRTASSAIFEARTFGGRLFKALFKEDILRLYRDALSDARSEGRGLRVTLCLSESPELIDVPWEYLFDEPDFLAVSAFTPVVRYLDLPRGQRPLIVEPPLRLLGVVSSPADYEQLDVERERSNLQGALSELSGAGAIELHWLEQPTLGGLLRALQSETFHALHYIGHGAYDRDAETGVLLFEDDAGWARPVTGDKLGMIVHDFSSLRLAVLNACEGARTARSDPFAGIAGSLVRRDIPAVVAMQFEISDEAAIVFAGGFYRPLAAGAPVDTSLAAARLAMLAERSDDIEWGTPVLFMRVPDGRLFDLRNGPRLPDSEGAEEYGAGSAPTSQARGNGRATAQTGRSVAGRSKQGRLGWLGRWLLLAGGAVVLAVVAGIVALSTGGSTGSRPEGARPFAIAYSTPWRSETGTPAVMRSGARLADGNVTLDAGQLGTSSRIPGGPPPALVRQYRRPTVSVTAQLAGREGREYTWLTSRREVTAYVLATTAGDDAIICQGPAGAAVMLQSCGELAKNARASGEAFLSPGPDQHLASEIASTLRPVVRARAGVHSLAGDPASRAQKAAGVAEAELGAAKALKDLATPPRYQPVVASLITALQHEGTQFAVLAHDANSKIRNAYSSTAKGLTPASRGLADVLRRLTTYQFAAPSLGFLSLTASLPAPQHHPNPPPTTPTTTPTTPTTTQTSPTTTQTTPSLPPTYHPPPPGPTTTVTTTPRT